MAENTLATQYPNAAPSFMQTISRDKPISDLLSDAQKKQLRETVAYGLSDAQLSQFIEQALVTGLDPFSGEIWAKLVPGPNGDAGRLLIGTGRDGLLALAERLPDWRGFETGVVYEHDDFSLVDPSPDSPSLRKRVGIRHHAPHPTKRGPVIGAWAVAEREGRPPRYFYCDVDDYAPPIIENPEKGSPEWYWQERLPVMIEKVPLSHVLRTLCNVGSVYLEEDMAKMSSAAGAAADTPLDPKVEADTIDAIIMALPAPVDWRTNLARTIKEINTIDPGHFGVSAIEMTFCGQPRETMQKHGVAADMVLDKLRELGKASTTTRPPEDGEPTTKPPAAKKPTDKSRSAKKGTGKSRSKK